VEFTRVIFEQIKKVDGMVKFTELSGVKHGGNPHAFNYKGDRPRKGWKTHLSSDRCDSTEDVWEWLFRQHR